MEVNKQCRNYITQTIFIVIFLNILGNIAMRQWGLELVGAMAVSMIFVLVVDIAAILVWRWVVKKHKEMLPSFFTGVSGFTRKHHDIHRRVLCLLHRFRYSSFYLLFESV